MLRKICFWVEKRQPAEVPPSIWVWVDISETEQNKKFPFIRLDYTCNMQMPLEYCLTVIYFQLSKKNVENVKMENVIEWIEWDPVRNRSDLILAQPFNFF